MLSKIILPVLALSFVPQAMAAAVVAPHRAVYDLQLLRTTQGANVTNVSGRMAYEITGSACDGWTVNFRLVNQYDYKDGGGKLYDTQSSSYETGDSKELNYSEKVFVDSNPSDEKRLSVKRESANATGSGNIVLPAEQKFEVPADAIFPMRHQLRLMDAAERGESRDAALVYDGSDGEKTVRAITAIGKRRDAGTTPPDVSAAIEQPLKGLPSWPVTIGYFATGAEDAETPIYQIGFNMFENGVSSNLVMDYGTFVLKGRLTTLEMLKPEPCAN